MLTPRPGSRSSRSRASRPAALRNFYASHPDTPVVDTMEEDDDFYGDDSAPAVKKDEPATGDEDVKDEKMDDSLEEGEEEEEDDSDSVRLRQLAVHHGTPAD